jgi:hypothetical protein
MRARSRRRLSVRGSVMSSRSRGCHLLSPWCITTLSKRAKARESFAVAPAFAHRHLIAPRDMPSARAQALTVRISMSRSTMLVTIVAQRREAGPIAMKGESSAALTVTARLVIGDVLAIVTSSTCREPVDKMLFARLNRFAIKAGAQSPKGTCSASESVRRRLGTISLRFYGA